ncbi:MAG: hypothetical protein Q7T74_07260 [Candidatus Saccharibacteria bacterium]|nr:hypothetical protein [Candidatus Saccharibacteria bacterium]
MINLIGPDRKKQLLAARRNSIWVRYNFLLVCTLITIVIVLGGTAFFYYGQKLGQDQSAEENNKQLLGTEYIKKKKVVDEFRKNLTTAKTVLDAETQYSDIILDIAKTMPPNTVISSLKFDSTTFQSQQTLEFRSKTLNDALALKAAFEKNPPLSSQVRFSNVSRADEESGDGADTAYPMSITMFMDLKKPTSSIGGASTSNGVSQ